MVVTKVVWTVGWMVVEKVEWMVETKVDMKGKWGLN